ncbi:MAG: hypothetical protein HC816_15545 [Leptolyngbyaceae cyanobacterium RM1_1_2]|nr:hypothetical protein [Leptolyngbyaceae cyanobacterium RM1_1_2]
MASFLGFSGPLGGSGCGINVLGRSQWALHQPQKKELMSQESGIIHTLTEPSPDAEPKRKPIHHILIGSHKLVERTVFQLHQARYAEVYRWTHPLEIPENRLILTPKPGEVMSLLVRLVQLA